MAAETPADAWLDEGEELLREAVEGGSMSAAEVEAVQAGLRALREMTPKTPMQPSEVGPEWQSGLACGCMALAAAVPGVTPVTKPEHCQQLGGSLCASKLIVTSAS